MLVTFSFSEATQIEAIQVSRLESDSLDVVSVIWMVQCGEAFCE